MELVPIKVPSVCEWVGLIKGGPLHESLKSEFKVTGWAKFSTESSINHVPIWWVLILIFGEVNANYYMQYS